MDFSVRFLTTVLALSLGCSAVFGCGASPRMLQQSTVYFEHCRSAELNPDISLDLRRECWAEWLTHYTEKQPLERTSYAQDRRIALAHGEELAPLPDRRDEALEFGHEHMGADTVVQGTALESQPTDGSAPQDPVIDASQPPPSDSAIVDEPPFRQDEGAPPGRHFPVRTVPPPDEVPLRPPPSRNASRACGGVCDPRWDRCVSRCHDFGNQCIAACETRHLQCVAACH